MYVWHAKEQVNKIAQNTVQSDNVVQLMKNWCICKRDL